MNFYTDDISNGYNWKGLERAIARLMGHLGGTTPLLSVVQVTKGVTL